MTPKPRTSSPEAADAAKKREAHETSILGLALPEYQGREGEFQRDAAECGHLGSGSPGLRGLGFRGLGFKVQQLRVEQFFYVNLAFMV